MDFMVRRKKKGLYMRTSRGYFDRVIQKIKDKGKKPVEKLVPIFSSLLWSFVLSGFAIESGFL